MNRKLKKLCHLMDFGADCMQAAKIATPDRLRGAKGHLLWLIVTAHNHCESVCELCKKARTHAALVLLRTVCECLVKARYLYCDPHLHVWELRLEAFREKSKCLNGMKGLIESGAPEKVSSARVSIDEVKASLNLLRYPMEYCERGFRERGGGFNKNGRPNKTGTLAKAKHVDKYNFDKGAKSESLEFLYHSVYRQLSSGVHVDGQNFSDYISWSEDCCEVRLSGDASRVPEVSELAIWLYSNLMRQFLKVYRIPRVRQMNVILADP